MELNNTLNPVIKFITIFFLLPILLLSCEDAEKKKVNAEEMEVRDSGIAELTPPPFVPKPVGNRPPKKLVINMEVIEKEMEMSNGVTYLYWTFDGTVPGSFIRTRVGDEIEFHLKNHPDSKLPHNIDLHAVNGPGGGAEASFVAPGKEAVFTFKALNPGLYVYHCATAPVAMHVANGMYGLILVEPAGGLPPVDKEYYIMQGDFYTEGETNEPGLQNFDIQKAIDEEPEYVVFNGKVGALTGEGAITAEVGETVRLYVGNGGPNMISSFHVIGEIFDKVYLEGGDMINENVGTTIIPAGGAAIVEMKVEVPGEYILVDHALFRAFNKGTLGILEVEGPSNNNVFGGKIAENDYNPGTSAEGTDDSGMPSEPIIELSKSEKMAQGEKIYTQRCLACHQATGAGVPNAFPPLASADFLNADAKRAIKTVKHGLRGEITVNGQTYNGIMPPQNLSDEEIASVLTYIYNNWGNNKTEVTTQMVRENR
ncbi:MAG TPA: copper-containing nitrite reductase [Salinimicrobium sp.]|nr:copper-containing nitrite reductase [Salinimicrobium sp.]